MNDFFSPLQSIEAGVLPISIHGSISDAGIETPETPMIDSFFDIVGPDSPPRPK